MLERFAMLAAVIGPSDGLSVSLGYTKDYISPIRILNAIRSMLDCYGGRQFSQSRPSIAR